MKTAFWLAVAFCFGVFAKGQVVAFQDDHCGTPMEIVIK